MANVKRKVTLAFPDLTSLLDFTMLIDLTNCEIMEDKSIVICELTEAEIELAVNGYQAVIVG